MIRDPVKARLDSPAANCEVHRSVVRIDDHIREGQGSARDEVLQLARVRRAAWRQVSRVEFAVAPVAREKRFLILRREFRSVAEADAGRRAWPDIDNRRQTVFVVDGELSAAASPAELGSADRVADSRRAVPGQVEIPLHVGVVGKQLAVRVERSVELVSKTGRHQLPVFAFWIDAADEAAGSPRASHEAALNSREEIVLIPVSRNSRRRDFCHLRPVSADYDERFSIRVRQHGMRSMLAGALQRAKHLDGVEVSVAVFISDPVEAAFVQLAFVDVHVEAVEGPQQTLSFSDVDVDFLNHCFGLRPELRWRHAVKRTVLVRDDQSAFRVGAHVDPGSLLAFRDGVKQLNLKPFGDFEVRDRGRFRLAQWSGRSQGHRVDRFRPGARTKSSDDVRLLPGVIRFEADCLPAVAWFLF